MKSLRTAHVLTNCSLDDKVVHTMRSFSGRSLSKERVQIYWRMHHFAGQNRRQEISLGRDAG